MHISPSKLWSRPRRLTHETKMRLKVLKPEALRARRRGYNRANNRVQVDSVSVAMWVWWDVASQHLGIVPYVQTSHWCATRSVSDYWSWWLKVICNGFSQNWWTVVLAKVNKSSGAHFLHTFSVILGFFRHS